MTAKKVNWNELRKAVSEFNDWKDRAIIWLDLETGSVWTGMYSSEQYFEVSNENVVPVYKKEHYSEVENIVLVREIKQRCDELLNK